MQTPQSPTHQRCQTRHRPGRKSYTWLHQLVATRSYLRRFRRGALLSARFFFSGLLRLLLLFGFFTLAVFTFGFLWLWFFAL